MASPWVEVQLILLRHPDQWWRRLDARSVICKLAPLLESVRLAVAKVAEDETTNEEWWVGER